MNPMKQQRLQRLKKLKTPPTNTVNDLYWFDLKIIGRISNHSGVMESSITINVAGVVSYVDQLINIQYVFFQLKIDVNSKAFHRV